MKTKEANQTKKKKKTKKARLLTFLWHTKN